MAGIMEAVKKAAAQANQGGATAPAVKVSDSSSLSANSSSGVKH